MTAFVLFFWECRSVLCLFMDKTTSPHLCGSGQCCKTKSSESVRIRGNISKGWMKGKRNWSKTQAIYFIILLFLLREVTLLMGIPSSKNDVALFNSKKDRNERLSEERWGALAIIKKMLAIVAVWLWVNKWHGSRRCCAFLQKWNLGVCLGFKSSRQG